MGFFSDLTVAADDLVGSLEETFTKRREKSLQVMRQKISTLIDDLGHCQAVYRAVALSVDEVMAAMTGLQGHFDHTVALTLPPNLQAEDIRPLAVSMAKYAQKAIKVSNWGLTAYQWLFMGTLYAQHGAGIAQHLIQTSEAAILGTIGQAAASSRLMVRPGTLSRQTSHLTKIGRWAETLGSIVMVANGIIVIIDVVMGAREIALMRHKVDELKASLKTLEDEVAKIDKAFSDLAETGSTLYLAVADDEADGGEVASPAMITGMFGKIRDLPKLLSGDPVAHKSFHELRIDVNKENVELRSHLVAKIQRQLVDLRLWQEQVETACRMLADGIEIDRLRRAMPKLSAEMLNMLADHVNSTTGDARFKPHFTSDCNGKISILPPVAQASAATSR